MLTKEIIPQPIPVPASKQHSVYRKGYVTGCWAIELSARTIGHVNKYPTMLYFEIPRGCFWCARGINKLLSLWLSVEILIYSEIIIMSWLYYFIREQYNLLPVLRYLKILYSLQNLKIINVEKLFINLLLMIFEIRLVQSAKRTRLNFSEINIKS